MVVHLIVHLGTHVGIHLVMCPLKSVLTRVGDLRNVIHALYWGKVNNIYT